MLDIQEVVRRIGLTSRTLRYYEARGLVQPLRTHKGRRLFGPEALERINQVVALKRAGFTLAQIEGALARQAPDLARLIDAQLAALAMRQQEMAEAMALLAAVSARLERGETIDVETFCALIRRGDAATDTDEWKQEMARRLFGDEQIDHIAARMWATLSRIDPETFRRQCAALYARIEVALPLDLDSAKARAFVDEWRALSEPILAVGKPGPAPPLPPEGVDDARARIDDWNRAAKATCPPKVWEFLFTAVRHRDQVEKLGRKGTVTFPRRRVSPRCGVRKSDCPRLHKRPLLTHIGVAAIGRVARGLVVADRPDAVRMGVFELNTAAM